MCHIIYLFHILFQLIIGKIVEDWGFLTITLCFVNQNGWREISVYNAALSYILNEYRSKKHSARSISHYARSISHSAKSISHFAFSKKHFAFSKKHFVLSKKHFALSKKHFAFSKKHFAISKMHFAIRNSHGAPAFHRHVQCLKWNKDSVSYPMFYALKVKSEVVNSMFRLSIICFSDK